MLYDKKVMKTQISKIVHTSPGTLIVKRLESQII